MKRFTIFAVLLGFFVVTLLIARPALTDQQGEKTDELAKIEKLQKERIEALEKIVAHLTKRYESGTLRR